MTRHTPLTIALLAGCCLLALIVYWPGLSGPFLFDDFQNLEKLGALGPIRDWELAQAYLTSGFAGPTGRPLSLASFLLDARDWPADPFSFKQTNLLIHILIGVVLFLTLRTLLRAIGRRTPEAAWIALITTALWLLNPFLVSTTLYVVQRMTQLATLFVLLGVWGYLQGRLWLATRPRLGYLTLTSSLVLGTLLAIFSKENGVLLPLLLLIMEFALRFHWAAPGPDWRWTAAFLWLPSMALVVYLLLRIPGADSAFAHREFSLSERLLTQPRFLWDYLWHLFVPHLETQGLYQDGRIVSTGWSTPWTTLPAVLALLGLAIAGGLARRTWPLFSLAILFFLAGHLLESTTIPLELYFEHRNYLPAVFLFLPVAAGIVALRRKIRPLVLVLVLLAWTGSYALATWQRASLWGKEDQLMLTWAQKNPTSPRAQSSAAEVMLRVAGPEVAAAYFLSAMRKFPDSALLTLNYLSLQASTGRLTADELQEAAGRLRRQPFGSEAQSGLRKLIDHLNNQPATTPEHVEIMMALLEQIRADGRGHETQRLTLYLQGMLMAGQGNGKAALDYFTQALGYYRSVEAALNMVSQLAGHGHYDPALAMLEQAAAVLAIQPDGELRRNRATYHAEIDRLRRLILEDKATN